MIVDSYRFGVAPAGDDLSDIPMIGRYEAWRETTYADNDPIPSLTDWSGSGNPALQATSGQRPVFKTGIVNGRAVARFDGVNDFLEAAGLSAMNNIATRWFYVGFRYTAYNNVVNATFALNNSGNVCEGDRIYVLKSSETYLYTVYVYGTSGQEYLNLSGATSPLGTFRSFKLMLDGTNAHRRATGLISPEDVRAQNTPAPNGAVKLILGDQLDTSGGAGAAGDLAYFFMGNTVLGSTEQSRIDAYILATYGIAA